MSKIELIEESVNPPTPPAGRGTLYFKDGVPHYMADDGVPYVVESATNIMSAHEGTVDPHPQYLTPAEADLVYAEIAHIHATGNLIQVTKVSPTPPGQFASVGSAIAAIGTGNYAAASSTNRYVIKVDPGEYTEDNSVTPLTVPAYVYVSGNDQWNSATLKCSDVTKDFIRCRANGGMFNVAVSGPTTAGMSAVYQDESGVTKLYWVNIKQGYYGITLKPSTAGAVARCHAIGVVTDGATMNRMFNCEWNATTSPGTGVFILMQSGPMSTTWTGANAAAIYLSGDGVSASPKANVTIDLCQFRGTGSSGQIYSDVYADNGALARGICVSFAGGSLTNTKYAINVGPNNGSGYKTKVDIHGSQIKPGQYTKDIKIQNAVSPVSYSGVATEANLDFIAGAQFLGTFADSSFGQVIYGELYVGNTVVKTPITAYIEADKNTGMVSGGGLSRGAGARQVDVDAGVAFIDTANGFKRVSWGATTVTVAANKPKVRIYVDNAGTVLMSDTGIDKTLNAQLGEVATDADSVLFLFDQHIKLPQFRPALYEYLEKVIGPINVSGGVVTLNATAKKLDVTDSDYYLTEQPLSTVGGTAITFNYWYRDGVGGWTAVEGQDTIDTAKYDDGSGTLANIPTGKFKRDLLMVGVSADGSDYHVFYGQTLFDNSIDAITNPNINDVIQEHACRLTAIIVQQGAAAIDRLEDQRPRLGQQAAAGGAITAHNDLSGRDSPSAHTQYQLASAKGNADGYASLDGSAKVPTAQLPTISDYTHGTQAGGTLHAEATGSVAGFMPATSVTKLATIASGATANDSDANLKARANHTGEQAISTVTGLQAALDAKIAGSRQIAVLGGAVTIGTNALADVTGVSVPVVAGTYVVKANIVYQSSGTGTGIAFSLNGPATSSVAMMKTIPTSATAAIIQTASAFATVQASATTTAANVDQYAKLEAVVTFTAPGTLVLRAASESNGTNVFCRAGTTMIVEKVA